MRHAPEPVTRDFWRMEIQKSWPSHIGTLVETMATSMTMISGIAAIRVNRPRMISARQMIERMHALIVDCVAGQVCRTTAVGQPASRALRSNGSAEPQLAAAADTSLGGGGAPTTDSCTATNNLSIRSPRRRGPVAIVALPYVTRSWRGVPTAARQRGELDRLSRRAQ
jgi:hypothetical protein